MRECNKVLDYAQASSTEGLYFASSGVTWDDAVVCTITDASFCNETIEVDGVSEPGRSQQGYIVCLAPAGIVNLPKRRFTLYRGVRRTSNECAERPSWQRRSP